jgi:hypothetical protein
MKSHLVQPGDCISSIAFLHGFFPDTLWNDPANAELRRKRKDPNVLVPGDVVAIPDLRPRAEDAKTGRVHRFRRKGVPEKLRIVLLRFGKPRKDLQYTLDVDGVLVSGQTDDKGKLEHFIPPNAERVRLRIGDDEEHDLALGHLTPNVELTAPSDVPWGLAEGIEQRLRNLGYLDDEDEEEDEVWKDEELEPGELPRRLRRALEAFQSDHDLELTGELDDDTRAALDDMHLS